MLPSKILFVDTCQVAHAREIEKLCGEREMANQDAGVPVTLVEAPDM